jgi:hypothetical protein
MSSSQLRSILNSSIHQMSLSQLHSILNSSIHQMSLSQLLSVLNSSNHHMSLSQLLFILNSSIHQMQTACTHTILPPNNGIYKKFVEQKLYNNILRMWGMSIGRKTFWFCLTTTLNLQIGSSISCPVSQHTKNYPNQ